MTTGQPLITPQGKKKIKEELELLKSKRKGIIERIAHAKEMGDLSENAEYHAAREEQSFNEGKIRELEYLLHSARVVAVEKGGNKVSLGSTVTIEADGIKATYHIVGANEASIHEQKISIESPLVNAMLGKKKGDTFEIDVPAGKKRYTIKDIQ